MTCSRQVRMVAVVLGVLGFWAGVPSPDAEGRGGGGGGTTIPPADSGVVYYEGFNVPTRQAYVMNTNGSGKAPLNVVAAPTGSWPTSIPTASLHGSERWFVQFRAVAGTYANGHARYELFAVNQTGSRLVQLSSSEVEKEPADGLAWAADGGVADGKVSYAGRTVTSDGASDGSVYVLPVDWTALLAGTLAPTALAKVAIPGLREPNYAAGEHLNLHHGWSPDGASLAYAQIWGEGKLYRVEADGSNRQLLWGAGVASGPTWSSLGEIAFFDRTGGQNGDLYRINSDGTGLVRILADPGTWKWMGQASWSPSGSHLVYQYTDQLVKGKASTNPADWTIDVRRVARDGTGAVNLTADVSMQMQVLGWRP